MKIAVRFCISSFGFLRCSGQISIQIQWKIPNWGSSNANIHAAVTLTVATTVKAGKLEGGKHKSTAGFVYGILQGPMNLLDIYLTWLTGRA